MKNEANVLSLGLDPIIRGRALKPENPKPSPADTPPMFLHGIQCIPRPCRLRLMVAAVTQVGLVGIEHTLHKLA